MAKLILKLFGTYYFCGKAKIVYVFFDIIARKKDLSLILPISSD